MVLLGTIVELVAGERLHRPGSVLVLLYDLELSQLFSGIVLQPSRTPASADDLQFSEDFHWGLDARTVDIEYFDEKGASIGELYSITYETTKGNEEPIHWVHTFRDGFRPMTYQDRSKRGFIFEGDVQVTWRGIQ